MGVGCADLSAKICGEDPNMDDDMLDEANESNSDRGISGIDRNPKSTSNPYSIVITPSVLEADDSASYDYGDAPMNHKRIKSPLIRAGLTRLTTGLFGVEEHDLDLSNLRENLKDHLMSVAITKNNVLKLTFKYRGFGIDLPNTVVKGHVATLKIVDHSQTYGGNISEYNSLIVLYRIPKGVNVIKCNSLKQKRMDGLLGSPDTP
eukprot:893890_1